MPSATPSSGRIVVGCRRPGGERLRLEVVDSGIGIPNEEQERIFDDYYQIGGASAQGLGLGLPIVKSLGALLGHRNRTLGAQQRQRVLHRARAGRRTGRGARVHACDAAGARRRQVVLVDDDVEIRDSMRLLLESWGCRYIGGATLADVERKLRAQAVQPDAVIVDYRLADASTGIAGRRRACASLFGKPAPGAGHHRHAERRLAAARARRHSLCDETDPARQAARLSCASTRPA